MDIKVVQLGGHMPLSARRVVIYFGKSTEVDTAIGRVAGMADGAVRYVATWKEGKRQYSLEWELTPEKAKEVGEAFRMAAQGVEQWQEHASGFNRIRVKRSADGVVTVTHRGRTRPMRLSKLRGSVWADGTRHFHGSCGACRARDLSTIYVAADDLREHGSRVHHVEVCQACVDRLANLPEEIAEVRSIAKEPSSP